MKDTHYKAFTTNFELVCQVSLIALIADIAWLIHDILANGLSFMYLLIGIGLLIGIIGTIIVLIRHHKQYMNRKISINTDWDDRMQALKRKIL